jgi:outer membrane protein assembly factor BamB
VASIRPAWLHQSGIRRRSAARALRVIPVLLLAVAVLLSPLSASAAPQAPGRGERGRGDRGQKSKRSRAAGSATSPIGIFPVEQIWQVDLEHDLTAPPGFDDLQAYVPEDGGQLVAYVLVNGRQRWSVHLPTALTPAAGGNLVYVATPGAMAAVAADDGHEVWRAPLSGTVSVRPTFDTGWLVAGTSDGDLYAWRARDGHPLWHVNVGAPLSAPVALGGNRLYAPLTDGRLLALDLETGHQVWVDRFGGAPAGVLPLESRIFVGSTDNYFYSLKTGSGEEEWRWRTGADIVGAPVVDQKRVYFVSLDNLLRALDRNSGTLQWQRALSLRPDTGPQLAGAVVLAAGTDPAIPAYRADDGTPAGGVQLTGQLAGPPHVTSWGFTLGPSLILATRALAQPSQLIALARAVDPPLVPLSALPGAQLTGY